MKWAGNAELPLIEARDRKACGGSAVSDSMRGKSRRVPILRRHPQLGETREENEPKARSSRRATRAVQRKISATLEARRSHFLHLRNNNYLFMLFKIRKLMDGLIPLSTSPDKRIAVVAGADGSRNGLMRSDARVWHTELLAEETSWAGRRLGMRLILLRRHLGLRAVKSKTRAGA